jgi:hypothetical protein
MTTVTHQQLFQSMMEIIERTSTNATSNSKHTVQTKPKHTVQTKPTVLPEIKSTTETNKKELNRETDKNGTDILPPSLGKPKVTIQIL